MKLAAPITTGTRAIVISSLGFVLASGYAKAAAIIQHETFSCVRRADATMYFERFDTMGGTRTLNAVFIEMGYTRTGGYAAFDKESPSEATVTLTSRTGMFVDNTLDFTELGSSAEVGRATAMRATSSIGVTPGPDDDPDDDFFNSTGDAFYHWDLPDITVSDSGYMDDTGQFVGTDSFYILMDGVQGEFITGVSGANNSTSPSLVSGFTTITYDYTDTAGPELGEWLLGLLGPLGLALLVILRRQR